MLDICQPRTPEQRAGQRPAGGSVATPPPGALLPDALPAAPQQHRVLPPELPRLGYRLLAAAELHGSHPAAASSVVCCVSVALEFRGAVPNVLSAVLWMSLAVLPEDRSSAAMTFWLLSAWVVCCMALEV